MLKNSQNLDSKKATQLGDIPVRIIKENKFSFWKILSEMLNFYIDNNAFSYGLKVGLPPSKKIYFYLLQWRPFKNDEKSLLIHLKSSFCSQDI